MSKREYILGTQPAEKGGMSNTQYPFSPETLKRAKECELMKWLEGK